MEFEKGKWYKRTDVEVVIPSHLSGYLFYFRFFELNNKGGQNTFVSYEVIDSDGKYKKTRRDNYCPDKVLVDIKEIMQYLPEGHPDKLITYEIY